MKQYDTIKKELTDLLVVGYMYNFFEFVDKAYQLIYVDSCKCTKEQVQSLRKIFKDYLWEQMFVNDVIPVKLTDEYQVFDPDKKLLTGTKYRIILAWKRNKRPLTEFDDYDCWMTER